MGITYYLHLCLDAVPMPNWFQRDYNLTFSLDEGILLLDLRIPDFSSMTFVKDRDLKSGVKEVPATNKGKLALIERLSAFLAIRLMWELQQVDDDSKLKLIACNGFVVRDDPATGLKRQDVILSVMSNPEALASLKLARLDPVACFRSLKGVAGAHLSELVPVRPLLSFNRADSRHIASREVSTTSDTNLAAMDWQDFEHLVRELFEKEFLGEGVEVRVTQASRDRGVDAIVYDPHPIKGGKSIIQAKRYTNTVDVSAVRDLYGTVIKEGANRGILVTTSSYGRDSFEFAREKPLTLLNGSELLHLLNKHGYSARIDIPEARRLLREGFNAIRESSVAKTDPELENK
jgi:restriction system protein